MTLTLVLADAELELVPDEIKAQPAVRASARREDKRPSRSLLDASVHHDALTQVEGGERRGRPDIVHFFLLLGLDSVLNKRRELQLLVHTRNDVLVTVNPETRLIRNYPRFVGLMEQLLRQGRVPRGRREPLLTAEEGWPLERVLDAHATGHRVALREDGDVVDPGEYLGKRAADAGDLTCVLGGFSRGDFRSPVRDLTAEAVSLGEEPLMAWTVASELIVHWEAATGAFADSDSG